MQLSPDKIVFRSISTFTHNSFSHTEYSLLFFKKYDYIERILGMVARKYGIYFECWRKYCSRVNIVNEWATFSLTREINPYFQIISQREFLLTQSKSVNIKNYSSLKTHALFDGSQKFKTLSKNIRCMKCLERSTTGFLIDQTCFLRDID